MVEIASKGIIGAELPEHEERGTQSSAIQDLRKKDPVARRKFLGWLGIGLFGTMAVRAIPLRFISSKSTRTRSKSKDIKAIPNELAVKRSKKV